MALSPETGWTDISEAVFFHAARRPQADAVIAGDDRVDYGELAQLVGAAAVYLHELGIRPHEVVGIAMPGTIDHVILALALIRIGAAPLDVPLPQPGQGPVQPAQFGIRQMFVPAGLAPPDGTRAHVIDQDWRQVLAVKSGDKRVAGDPDADFYLSFTSGSTGAAKAILTTRRQWQARYCTGRRLFPFLLDPQRPANLLVIGGLAFSAFFFFLANQLFIGGPIVLMTGAHHPDALAAAINEWDDAALMITPPVAREFLFRAPRDGVLFPRARALFIGAAPFFGAEKRAARTRLSPNTYEVYGSAATGFLATLPPGEIEAHADSVGRPVADVEIEIVEQHGKRVPAGQTGHIRVRGPGISKGFFGNAVGETTVSEGFREGWYYPGDLGAIDDDGFLSLRGRASDVIRRRGVEIYPPDLEQVFLAHPSIGEVAVIGAQPPGMPEPRVLVFAAGRAELQPQELAQHCRNALPPERLPDQVFFLAQLPKTATGKVDAPRLRAMAEQQALRAAGETATNSAA